MACILHGPSGHRSGPLAPHAKPAPCPQPERARTVPQHWVRGPCLVARQARTRAGWPLDPRLSTCPWGTVGPQPPGASGLERAPPLCPTTHTACLPRFKQRSGCFRHSETPREDSGPLPQWTTLEPKTVPELLEAPASPPNHLPGWYPGWCWRPRAAAGGQQAGPASGGCASRQERQQRPGSKSQMTTGMPSWAPGAGGGGVQGQGDEAALGASTTMSAPPGAQRRASEDENSRPGLTLPYCEGRTAAQGVGPKPTDSALPCCATLGLPA